MENLLNYPITLSRCPYDFSVGGEYYIRGAERCRMLCRDLHSKDNLLKELPLPVVFGPDFLSEDADRRLYREGFNFFLKQVYDKREELSYVR